DTQITASHFAVLDELSIYLCSQLRGNCEANTGARPCLRKNQRVDADNLTLHIDERTAGVPGIDRRIGLDEVCELAVLYVQVAASCGYYSRSHCLLEPKRASQRNYPLTLLEDIRVTQLCVGQVLRIDLDDRKIGLTVLADNLCL